MSKYPTNLSELESQVETCLSQPEFDLTKRYRLVEKCLGLDDIDSKKVFMRPERLFRLMQLPVTVISNVEKVKGGFYYKDTVFDSIEDVAKHYYASTGIEAFHTEGNEIKILGGVCSSMILNEFRESLSVFNPEKRYLNDSGLIYRALTRDLDQADMVAVDFASNIDCAEFACNVREAVKAISAKLKKDPSCLDYELGVCAVEVASRTSGEETANWVTLRKKDAAPFVQAAVSMLGFKACFEKWYKSQFSASNFDLVCLDRTRKRFNKVEVKNNDYFTSTQLSNISSWWIRGHKQYDLELCVARTSPKVPNSIAPSRMNNDYVPANPWSSFN